MALIFKKKHLKMSSKLISNVHVHVSKMYVK